MIRTLQMRKLRPRGAQKPPQFTQLCREEHRLCLLLPLATNRGSLWGQCGTFQKSSPFFGATS